MGNYFFVSIIFLHSAFIFSSAFAESIFLHSSIFLSSFIAPPCDAAIAPKDTVATAAAINTDTNLRMNSLQKWVQHLPAKWLAVQLTTGLSTLALTRLFRMRVCTNAAVLAALALSAFAAPRTPASDQEVLEKLPVQARDATARELARQRAAFEQSPTDPALAVDLAQAYFDLAMARGDPRYVGYAQAVVDRTPPKAAPLLLLRGVLRQYRHDFAGALQDMDAALALDSDLASAQAWRGAIYLVQADYGAAASACSALQALQRNTMAGGCQGMLQAYSGRLQAGYQTLQQTLQRSTDPDQRLWLLTRLGEVAAWRGDTAAAREHYRAALALGRDDVYLLAAYADFLLDAQHYAEVVRLLESWEAADSLLLRLTEAETVLQAGAAARHQRMLEERFAAARARGDTTHRAEEARYWLRVRQEPKTALVLAQANYTVQREPRDARVLLEAALAARNHGAAAPVREWMRRSGFEDPLLRRLAALSEAPTPSGSHP